MIEPRANCPVRGRHRRITSLISSGEHLRLVIDGLERENLYSTAQHTALRGALVGAAQAVWILHPDDPAERRERGLRVIAYGYDELRKYHQKTLQIKELLGLDDSERVQVDDQIAWIRGRESSVSNARNNRTTRLNLTEVIKESSSLAFANQKDQAALQLWWSALSSDAHVLVWGLVELGPLGIRVNMVAPGPIQTGYITADDEAKIAAATPLRRVGRPDDVADVICFLCSDQARWLTGQTIFVGGGWRVW